MTTAPLRRIAMLAGAVVRTLIRQRLPIVVALVALAVWAAVQVPRLFHFGQTRTAFAIDLGCAVISVLAGGLAVVVPAHAFLSELDMGTPWLLVAKGVRRVEIIWGHLVGHSLIFAGLSIVTVGTLWLALLPGQMENRGDLGMEHDLKVMAFVAMAGAYWLKWTVLAGISLAVASFSRSLIVAIGQGLGLAVLCHVHGLMDVVRGHWSGEWRAGVLAGVQRICPDFRPLDFSDLLASGAEPTLPTVTSALAVGLAYTLTMGGFASVIFACRAAD